MFGFNRIAKQPVETKSLSVPNIQPPIILSNGDVFYPGVFTSNLLTNKVLVEMYGSLPEIQIPINYVLDNLATIPIKHVSVLSDGSYVELKNSYQLRTLKKPNQWQTTQAAFIKQLLLNRIVLGISYINRIEGVNGEYTQLYVLPSETTLPKFTINSQKDLRINTIQGYITDFGYGQLLIPEDQVMVDREASFIDITGASSPSRLFSAILTSDSLRYNYEAKVKMYKDRGALGLIFPKEAGAVMSKEAADKMRATYYTSNGITGDKSPFLIGTIPLDYVPVTFDANSLRLSENRIQDFNMICSLIGVDSVIFGITQSTFSNKEWAEKDFWLTTAVPTFDSLMGFLGLIFDLPNNEKFIGDYKDIPILQSDNKSKVTIYSTMYKDGVISKEEYREGMNLMG